MKTKSMRQEQVVSFILERMNANIGNTPVFDELLLIVNEIQKKPVFPDFPKDKIVNNMKYTKIVNSMDINED